MRRGHQRRGDRCRGAGDSRAVRGRSCRSAPIEDSDVVLLAIKPQQMHAVAGSLRDCCEISWSSALRRASALPICRAGWAAMRRIVRVMPNTPALVLAGDLRPVCHALRSRAAERHTRRGDSRRGRVRRCGSSAEELMDAVTAVSGSGPAYVFYFMEALEQAARELGLIPTEARRLSLETFFGAAQPGARRAARNRHVLRARVTSKGGTTERALRAWTIGELKPQLHRSRQAGCRSARASSASELGAGLTDSQHVRAKPALSAGNLPGAVRAGPAAALLSCSGCARRRAIPLRISLAASPTGSWCLRGAYPGSVADWISRRWCWPG